MLCVDRWLLDTLVHALMVKDGNVDNVFRGEKVRPINVKEYLRGLSAGVAATIRRIVD